MPLWLGWIHLQHVQKSSDAEYSNIVSMATMIKSSCSLCVGCVYSRVLHRTWTAALESGSGLRAECRVVVSVSIVHML